MPTFQIDAASWTALSRALDEALELPPEARPAWLENLSPEYAFLKPQLLQLLARTQTSSNTEWTIPKLDVGDSGTYEGSFPGSENAGDIIGSYRLLRQLAVGGMGTVWLAERSDGLIARPVALKLPRGSWRGAVLAERMGREREILASLNHPNIARLYDAGLKADGQPYLALEYVEGRRIDEYCRERRLDLKARLRLFLQVANAIAHAHAHLVVHRDVKPANILVTGDGQVRLLDFGIAKLLEQGDAGHSDLTLAGGQALTPAYASPEQISGALIGIGSDVYSLGVVLYELLTSRLPYKPARDSQAALEEAILQVEPTRPSEVVSDSASRRALRGDLDLIVLKALKKKADERYLTVHAFVDDIERYLDGRAVHAQPDRWSYRVSKFVRRHRVMVGAAAVVLLAVLLGAGIALWQARVARTQKETADDVKDFIASIFRDSDPYSNGGKTLSVTDLLMQARNKVDRLDPSRTELRVELLNLISDSLFAFENQESAEAVARQAVSEADRLPPDHPQALRAHLQLAMVYQYRGHSEEMKKELDRVMPVVRRNPDANQDNLLRALETEAHWAIDAGKYEEARARAREGFELAERRLGPINAETASFAMLLAVASTNGDQPPEVALQAGERAFRIVSAAYQDRPRHPRLIDAREIYGVALARTGQLVEGIQQIQQAANDAAAVFGDHSTMAGFFLGNLSKFQCQAGDLKTAMANRERSMAILAPDVPADSSTHAASLMGRGMIFLAERRSREALSDLSKGTEIFRHSVGPNHEHTLSAQFHRAQAMAYLGRIAEAKALLKPVLEQYGAAYQSPNYSPHQSVYVLGVAQRFGGEFDAAVQAQQKALMLIPDGPVADLERMPILAELGLSQLELGRFDEAQSSLERAHSMLRSLQTQMTPHHAEVLVGLGRLKLHQGRAQDAQAFFDQATAFWANFDPDNRWAGEALFWSSRCLRFLGRESDASRQMAHSRKILSHSPIPIDARLLASSHGS